MTWPCDVAERPSASPIHDNADLEVFKRVLEEALAEFRRAGCQLLADEQVELTRIRLAAAIFLFADRGERDPARLKKLAKCLLEDAVEFPTLLRVRGALHPGV